MSARTRLARPSGHSTYECLRRSPARSRRPRSTRVTARSALAWSSSAAGTCPSNTPASPTSTMAVRTRAGLFDVSHMGEIEIAGSGRPRGRPVDHEQRRLPAVDRAGAVLGAHDTRGHLRRRRAGLSAGGRALHAGRQRVEHHEGLRLDRDRRSPAGDAVAVNTSSRYALHCPAGPGGARSPADADRRRSRRYQVLLVRARVKWPACASRSRARATPARTASRSSCRRRRRSASGTRSSLAGASAGHQSRRPGRARHAAARGRDAPVRQRHGRHDDGPRGRSRLDRRLEEGRVRRRTTS